MKDKVNRRTFYFWIITAIVYSDSMYGMIIVLKDTASYRVAKRVAPSLSLLKGPSLKIRKRTILSQRIGKLFMALLSLPT